MGDDNELAARDRGLSSLGLLMQLGGTVFAAATIVYMFLSLIGIHGDAGDMLVMFFILGLCGVRSMFHRQAGTDLLYGRRVFGVTDAPQDYLAGVRRYVGVAFAHTAVVGLLLWGKYDAPAGVVLGVSAGLALWPTILAIMLSLPTFKQFKTEMPATEDKGFEGASILMATLGGIGVCSSTVALLVMFKAGGYLMQGPGVLLMLALIMLAIRSFIHLQAGIAGLRETSVERSVDLANRYANFGVITSFCAGGALLLLSMATSLNVLVLALVCALVWVLMAWPLIIRRFFSDRQFADLVAGEAAPMHRRARDAGLSGLGWLLVTSSVLGISLVLPSFIAGRPFATVAYEKLLGIAGISFEHSMWWSVGFAVLQAWAGIELIKMSTMHRTVGSLYAIAGAIMQIYLLWPMLDMFWHGGSDSISMAVIVGSLARVLALPIATLILVNRRLAPTALARFRTRKP